MMSVSLGSSVVHLTISWHTCIHGHTSAHTCTHTHGFFSSTRPDAHGTVASIPCKSRAVISIPHVCPLPDVWSRNCQEVTAVRQQGPPVLVLPLAQSQEPGPLCSGLTYFQGRWAIPAMGRGRENSTRGLREEPYL